MLEFEIIDIINKICRFQYTVEYGDDLLKPDEITFKVFSIPENEIRWFSYRLTILDNYTAKKEMLDVNAEFAQKGIPEKIIEIASKYLKRCIISSPIGYNPGNYLIPSARKVWERLVLKNSNVKFVQDKGHFIMEYKLY